MVMQSSRDAHMISGAAMLPKAIGVCSDWGFHRGTLHDRGGPMEQNWV